MMQCVNTESPPGRLQQRVKDDLVQIGSSRQDLNSQSQSSCLKEKSNNGKTSTYIYIQRHATNIGN